MINKILETISKLYKNNKGTFNSIFVYAACLFVAKKFGVRIPGINSFVLDPTPISDTKASEPEEKSDDYKRINDPHTMPGCDTYHERAISALWRAGVSSNSDYTKGECAEKIANYIRSLGPIDDDLAQYAILAMTKIAQTVRSDYTKGVITDSIIKLSKNIVIVKKEEN